jgi:hypothetical protein
MDIGKSFTYAFEDPNWIMKILIGGIVLLIPIVNFAVYGYMLTTLKNVADGQPNPLPEWSDFGAHFMKGLYAFVGILVYFLPAIVVYCCVFALSFGVSAAAGAAGGRDAGNAAASLLGLITLCLQCLVGIYALFAGLTLYAPLTRFAMSANQLSIFWDFRGNLDFIMKNLTNYIIALLIAWVASFIAGFGIILCFVGVLFTSFWATTVGAHVFGQLWRNRASAPAAA